MPFREVANFQSQLAERETIKERITRINESLTQIDYNAGRYIVLEAVSTPDADIRDFQSELRSCTEGTLTGSDDTQYSEGKFLQVKQIIERFRGREGLGEQDRRWSTKVTDVRNWFVFAASERWREDDTEHEHYSDSGGKSGGQKESSASPLLRSCSLLHVELKSRGKRHCAGGRVPTGDRRAFGVILQEVGAIRPAPFCATQLATADRDAFTEDSYHRTLCCECRFAWHRSGRTRVEVAQYFYRRVSRGKSKDESMSWTTPADLRKQVMRLWERGELLGSLARGETLFPKRLTLKGPSSAEIAEQFEGIRQWIMGSVMTHCRVESRGI